MSDSPEKRLENSQPLDHSDSLPPGESLKPYAPLPTVARLNRKTLLMVSILAVGIGALVLIIGFRDSAHQKNNAAQDSAPARPTDGLVDEHVRDLPKDYTFDVRAAAASIGYGINGAPATATQPAPLSAEQQAALAEQRRLAELRKQLLEQQRKELEQALDSPLVFASTKRSANATESVGTVRNNNGDALASTYSSEPSMQQDQHTMDMTMAALMRHSDNNPLTTWESRQMAANDKDAFMSKGASIEPYLAKPLIGPLSRYELKAGSVIAGALITGINTDLPGEIIGQVTENVFDTVTGKYLLIPQGSRLLGKYQNAVANGQNRALIVWRRLILPDGKSIVLEGMPGTDAAGLAGLKDKVDYHMNKLVGAAAMTTALAYAGNLARNPSSNSNGNSNADVIGDTVAQQTNRIGDKILDRELDVQPTITIRPGWPFRVLINKDMVLSPYTP